jgi:hypothetical protein
MDGILHPLLKREDTLRGMILIRTTWLEVGVELEIGKGVVIGSCL